MSAKPLRDQIRHTYIANDTSPPQRRDTGPHSELVFSAVIVKIGECDAGLDDRVRELVVDFNDLVHPMQVQGERTVEPGSRPTIPGNSISGGTVCSSTDIPEILAA